jgi:hypothetical protein
MEHPRDREDDRPDLNEGPAHERRTFSPSPPPPPPPPPEDDMYDGAEFGDERQRRDPGAIRAEDTEPYIALQYVARLFKIAAMVVVVALTAEVIAGMALEGAGAIFPLFAEVIRGVVLAAILWGAGDLTILLIDVGHDVRAARVLLGRLSARAAAQPGSDSDVPR